MPVIPADVAFQARYSTAASPEPFPESGATRVLRPHFCFFVTPMPTVTFVEDVRCAASELPAVLAEVRDLLRSHGRSQAAWALPAASDLVQPLRDAGLTPYTDPPLGPTYSAMALVTPPLGTGGEDVEVRECTELSEFVAVGELAADLFDMSADDRAGMVDSLRRRYEQVQSGRTRMRTYFALLESELVGESQSTETDFGTNLSGASVVPAARGRGVYRAFVAARWEAAVARRLPALTVQAGDMSAPILAKLGFTLVDDMLLLCDRL